MVAQLWTSPMVETLLDHVEGEKGEHGLYITDEPRAFREARNLLSQE